MTSAEFKVWRERLGLSPQSAAEILDLSKGTIELCERGERRDDNRPVEIPTTVELSCKYLAQQARLRRQLEALETGKMTTRTEREGRLVDSTEESKQEIREPITERCSQQFPGASQLQDRDRKAASLALNKTRREASRAKRGDYTARRFSPAKRVALTAWGPQAPI